MANHDRDAPSAADQAADQRVRDEAAGPQPGAEGPDGDSRGAPGAPGTASGGTADEPEQEQEPAGEQLRHPDAAPGEAGPHRRSAENAPYLPPGPNPFPSAYPPAGPQPAEDYGPDYAGQPGYDDGGYGQPFAAEGYAGVPPGPEPSYGAQPSDYDDGQDAAVDWYYEAQQGQQAYPDPAYPQPEYGPQYGAQYGPGYGAGYYEDAVQYGQPMPPPPGQPAPGQPVPGQPVPGQAAPGQAAPGQAAPGRGPSGQVPPGYPQPPPGYGGGHLAAGYGPPSGPEALAPLPPRGPDDQQPRETAESLTSESLLPARRPVPGSGWRRAVYMATGGLVRPGESHAELLRREMIARARTPVAGGHHRVAVMSLKGGVGKTTTTVGLGSMLASLRGDRVIAVDANPDRGTLSDKVRLETAATVRDLLNEREQIRRYADVRAFTSQSSSRLEVLASDRDPAVSVAFSEDDYYEVAQVLEHFYSICITDCGTGLLHSAMAGVLALADQIVLVSSPSVDGARSASATLDWLDAHDYGDLVRNAVVVLSVIRPRSKSTVDLDRLEQHFAGRCRAVARIPYDPYLEEGAEVDLDRLEPETAETYLALAAMVGDGFAWPRSVQRAAS